MASLVCSTAATVSQELQRILGSKTFRNASAQKRFIAYIVEQTLSGQSQLMSEYKIAVEALGRRELFDPGTDSIVRVEAGRLRAKLAKYYRTEGANNPVRIEISKGAYTPSFHQHEDERNKSEISHAAGTLLEETKRLYNLRRYQLAAICVIALALSVSALFWAAKVQNDSVEPLSIAVFPFTSLSGDSLDDQLGKQLAQEVIDSLVRTTPLRVAAQSSSFQVNGRNSDIRGVGRKLHVRNILEGSILRDGNRVRLFASISDTVTGYQIWATSFEQTEDAIEPLDERFRIQDEISRSVSRTLTSKPMPPRVSALRSIASFMFPSNQFRSNAESTQEYLRGLYYTKSESLESADKAVEHFERAVTLDPEYSRAYLGLSAAYLRAAYMSIPALEGKVGAEMVPKVRRAAEKALDLDPSLHEAHWILGRLNVLDRNWIAAEAEFRESLRLEPSDALSHCLYADFLIKVGRFTEAVEETELGRTLEPNSQITLSPCASGRALYNLRRYDEAIREFDNALAIDPNSATAHRDLGRVYLMKGMLLQGAYETEKANRMLRSPFTMGQLGYAYGAAGQFTQARRILNELLEGAEQHHSPAAPIAEVLIGVGQKDQALSWLKRAIDERDPYMHLKSDPIYDSLRSDARFSALLRREGVD